MIECKNCGTYSNYRRVPADDFEIDGAKLETYKCACGRVKHQVCWVKVMVLDRQDGEIVHQHYCGPKEKEKEVNHRNSTAKVKKSKRCPFCENGDEEIGYLEGYMALDENVKELSPLCDTPEEAMVEAITAGYNLGEIGIYEVSLYDDDTVEVTATIHLPPK